jgi:hypothetical protein
MFGLNKSDIKTAVIAVLAVAAAKRIAAINNFLKL